ncbi:MAG: toll/interleukin-1 receptor domain-containing protein [Clostridia bacterium]|nr:toll/interleukin-1 receptor domain-containing protein [Clostridia bacterium]
MFKSKKQEKNTFEFITRAGSSTLGKPKVFLAFHQDDKEVAFEIANDILSYANVAICYPTHNKVSRDEIEFVISMSSLLVLPITNKLLAEEKELFKNCIDCANKQNISILPVLFDKNIDDSFNQLSGNLHLCIKNNSSSFEKSYDQRLKEFLTSLFISDDLVKEVREAFDTYIFLSYRKKDKFEARELIKDIHSDKQLRNVAVWYDEFLSPGENFNTEIEDALKKSDIFALLVTPNLLEPSNYVLSTEYPMALNENKEILPAEKVKTSRHSLAKNYQNLPEVIDGSNASALVRAIKDKLKKLAVYITDNPEHNYYVGLAYLYGIDVELNKGKGIEILKESAKAGFVLAMEKLANIYKFGDGVKMSLKESLRWTNMAVEAYKTLVKTDKNYEINLATMLVKAGYLYSCLRENKKGLEVTFQALPILENAKTQNIDFAIDLFKALDSLADQLMLNKREDEALEVLAKLDAQIKQYDFKNQEDMLFFKGQTCYKLANVYLGIDDDIRATEVLDEALEIFRKLFDINPNKYEYFLACILDSLASIYFVDMDIKNTVKYRKEAMLHFEKALKGGMSIVKEDYYNCVLLLSEELLLNDEYDEHFNCSKKLYDITKEKIEANEETSVILLARVGMKLGLASIANNNLEKAKEYLEESYELIKKEMKATGIPYFNDIAIVQLALARVFKSLKQIDKQVYYLTGCVDTICNFCEEKEPEHLDMLTEMLDFMYNIMESQDCRYDFMQYYEQILRYFKECNDIDLLGDIMRLAHTLSVLYAVKGDFNKQITVLLETLEYSGKAEHKKDISYIDDAFLLFSVGMAYKELNNEKQEEYFLKTLDCCEKNFGKKVPEEAFEMVMICGENLQEFYQSKKEVLKQKLIAQRVNRLVNRK